MSSSGIRSTFNLLVDCHTDLRKVKSFFKSCATITKGYSVNMQKELGKLGRLSDSFALSNLMLLEYVKSFQTVFLNYEMQAMEFNKCHEKLKVLGNNIKEQRRKLSIDISKIEAQRETEQTKSNETKISQRIVEFIKEIISNQFESFDRFNTKLYSFNCLIKPSSNGVFDHNANIQALHIKFIKDLESSTMDDETIKLIPIQRSPEKKEAFEVLTERIQTIHQDSAENEIEEQYKYLPLSQVIDAKSISNTIIGLKNLNP